MKLVRKLIRLLCMRSHRSGVATGLVPMNELRSAVVFAGSNDPDRGLLERRVRAFMGAANINVQFVYPDSRNIRTDSDLFISLVPKSSIDERYAALSSTARFKVGRHQLSGGVYDLVVTDNESVSASSTDAFETISNLITNIR